MLKPARMTRILVGGHRDHLDAAVEELHAAGAVHLEDYRDPTAITEMGTPFERGDQVSDLLVRARGLQKALGTEDVEPRDMPREQVTEAVAEAEQACMPVLDRLTQARAEVSLLRAEAQQLNTLQGLDADLGAARTVTSLRVYVGTVREDPGSALASIEHDIVLSRQGRQLVAAVSVRPDDASHAERALAEAGFTAIQIPDVEGTPDEALAALAPRLAAGEAAVEKVEAEADVVRAEWGGRLATLEHELAEEADKTQAPLHFGVTANTFHVEGWVPRSRAGPLRSRLADRFGESLYFEALGDAPLTAAAPATQGPAAYGDPHEGEHAHVSAHDDHGPDPADEPPTKLTNKGPSRNYEFLLRLLALPKYKELDPTKLIAIFFPLFFGLMVGDLAIGLIIMGLALWLRKGRIFGIGGNGVAKPMFWGGFWAMLIGLLIFGEALGLHFVVSDEALADGEHSWESVLGVEFPTAGFIHKEAGDAHEDAALHATAHDGLDGAHVASDDHSPTADEVAVASFSAHAEEATAESSLFSAFAPHGGTHLSVNGWFNLGYYSKIHDVEALLLWSVAIGFVHLVLGFVLGVRNVAAMHGMKLAVQEKLSWLLIIASTIGIVVGLQTGLAALLWPAVAVLLVSVGLLWMGVQHTLGVGFVAILELPSLLGNLLSYTRLAAIGASKAGMAIAFATIGFELIGGPVGWIIYLGAAALITLLAILAGFLQSLRLQFVEFFSKFYEGGGRPYTPFGRRAT